MVACELRDTSFSNSIRPTVANMRDMHLAVIAREQGANDCGAHSLDRTIANRCLEDALVGELHGGHQAVLRRAADLARRRKATTVAFTFDRAPGAVLSDSPEHPRLTLLGEKVGLLREAGAGEVRVLRFTAGLASKSAGRFLADHLLADYELGGWWSATTSLSGAAGRGPSPCCVLWGRSTAFRWRR